MTLPHPSPAGPQLRFCSAQVRGTHVVVGGGGTHDWRSQIMYSRVRSWGVRAAASHSSGKMAAFVELWLFT